MLNCPNCGSPIVGDKCQYCGTEFKDWTDLDFINPVYFKIKSKNKIVMVRAVPKNIELNYQHEPCNFYADNVVYHSTYLDSLKMNVEFECVRNDRGNLYETIEEKD